MSDRAISTPSPMNQKTVLPLVLIVLAAGAGWLYTMMGDEGSKPVESLEFSKSTAVGPGNSGGGQLPTDRRISEPVRLERDTSSTVVLPLELEFELTNAKAELQANGVPPLGSAASARLRGSVHGSDGRGLRGYVEFVAGPNRGRVLDTDAQGRFGANDLLAGLSLVSLNAPGTPGAQREVLLREKRETQLNVGFGRPAALRGIVRDDQNIGIPTVRVVIDGQDTLTDERGRFYLPRVASGKVPVYLSKPGYASQREMQYITAGTSMKADQLKYTLRKGATVKVVVPERVGTGSPGQLFLSGPLDGTASRTYPWHLKSPITLFGGESIEIEDLAPGPIRLQYFRAGAAVTPPVVRETLVAGSTRTITFHLKAAPILAGVVVSGDKPVEGALVRLEAPDVTGASVGAMGAAYGRATVEMDVLSQMPPAVQSVVTGLDGKFRFSAAESLSAQRYLTAKSSDGKAWAGRVIEPGDTEVELRLEAAKGGRAGFNVETTERFQALPVRYVVNGKPSYEMLPAGERLEIADLPEGLWKVSATWGSEVILKEVPMDIDSLEDLFIPLPDGAVQGQPKSMRDAMQ